MFFFCICLLTDLYFSGYLFNFGGKDQLTLGLTARNSFKSSSWFKWNSDTQAFEDTGVTNEKEFSMEGTAMIPMNFFFYFKG